MHTSFELKWFVTQFQYKYFKCSIFLILPIPTLFVNNFDELLHMIYILPLTTVLHTPCFVGCFEKVNKKLSSDIGCVKLLSLVLEFISTWRRTNCALVSLFLTKDGDTICICRYGNIRYIKDLWLSQWLTSMYKLRVDRPDNFLASIMKMHKRMWW